MHFLLFISLLLFDNDWLAILLSFILQTPDIIHPNSVHIEVEFAQNLSFPLLNLALSVLSLLFGLCLVLSRLLLWIINSGCRL